MRTSLLALAGCACHHLFALPCRLGQAYEQCGGWVRPGEQVERSGVCHGRPAYRTAYPPPLHPAT